VSVGGVAAILVLQVHARPLLQQRLQHRLMSTSLPCLLAIISAVQGACRQPFECLDFDLTLKVAAHLSSESLLGAS
jgi:hypothetical protein